MLHRMHHMVSRIGEVDKRRMEGWVRDAGGCTSEVFGRTYVAPSQHGQWEAEKQLQ